MKRSKIQKKKDREERLRKERHFQQCRSLYPQFAFVNEHVCTAGYVNLVKDLVSKIDFQKLKFPIKDEQLYFTFLKNVQKFGYKYAFGQAADCIDFMSKIVSMSRKAADEYMLSDEDSEVKRFYKNTSDFVQKHDELLAQLGNNIIMSQGNNNFLDFHPEQGFRIAFVRDQICFIFQRLYNKCIEYNNVIHYMIQNQVEFGSKKYNLFFTRHAIDRIVQRFSKNGKTDYKFYSLLYKFFNYMKCRMHHYRGQAYIQFYYPCIRALEPTVKKIINQDEKVFNLDGEEYDKSQGFQVYVKCFLSPVKIYGDNIFAITALLPGYDGTPEWEVLQKNARENMKVRDKVRHLYFTEVDWCSPEYAEAIEFFHHNKQRQIFFEEPIPCWNPFNLRNYYDHEKQIEELLHK